MHKRVNCEAIWAGEWIKINRSIPHLLGHLLAPDGAKRDWAGRAMPVHVTRRDAAVAASIIQWLGTNVGNGFVLQCQKRVNDALTKHTEIGVKRAIARGRRDDRTPLQRRKARLDQARERIKKAVK